MPTVLIIEDDPAMTLMYRRVFERYFECDVTDAPDGESGLLAIAEKRPDLVVLDVHLPTMSGVEVLEAIRGNADIAGIAVIAITSENQRPVIEKLVQGRVLDILLKPIVLTRDLERIRKVLTKIPKAH